jgi:hypothetical protein
MTFLEEKILRAIAGGATTIAAVRRGTNSYAWSQTRPALDALIERGMVKRGRGTLVSLTATGRASVAPAAAPPMRPYVPPKPGYRREGTDAWKSYPSLVDQPRRGEG